MRHGARRHGEPPPGAEENSAGRAKHAPVRPETAERKTPPLKRFFKHLGPGLITGASDDDPSGIGTYVTAGSSLGYATLWTAPITLPLMAAVQYICARVGMVTGQGLAGVLRRHYPRWVLYPAILSLFAANTINAGADIGAIAAGVHILVPIPTSFLLVLIALSIVALQVWGSYRLIARVFKWFTVSLLAYVAAALYARPDLGAVLHATFVPTIRTDHAYLTTILAILGTTISPYLFFWQASEEVEEEVRMGRKTLRERRGATAEELRIAAWDVDVGMVFCNLIFYFVILAAAATLHTSGRTEITSAADAAEALRPIAGEAAGLLFAVGIVGSGLLAVPVLTGATAYAICEAFGWRYGLDERPGRARQFYFVIVLSTAIGLAIDFLGVNPIRALFWSAVINGVLAPPILLLIMLLSNNRAVMGRHTNGPLVNLLGWMASLIMFAAAVAMFATWE